MGCGQSKAQAATVEEVASKDAGASKDVAGTTLLDAAAQHEPTVPTEAEAGKPGNAAPRPPAAGPLAVRPTMSVGSAPWKEQPLMLDLLRKGVGTPSDVWMQASFETQLGHLLREHPYLEVGYSDQPHPLQYWFGRCREMSRARQFGRAQGHLHRVVTGVRLEDGLVAETFRRFDADSSGDLNNTEFRHMCAYLGWDEEDETLMDLDRDGKVSQKDMLHFVGHFGGMREFFEKRRLRISTSRNDVDRHEGIVVGAHVRAHFYTQGQKSHMWREATVCEIGVVQPSRDGMGPQTVGVRLEFKFGPGGRWINKQVVPMRWVLGQVENEEVNTACREAGISVEQQSYWGLLLPDTELETMQRLVPCQRQALQNVRRKAEERHAGAMGPIEERMKKLGYGEHVLRLVLDWVQDLAPIVIHIKLDDVGRFLETDEYYRSQFETKTSNGALDSENVTRQGWERSLFGGAYENAKPFERCKYGALNIMNDYRGVLSAKQYGDSYLVLKDVRLRTTFTHTDSSCCNIENLGVLDKYAHILLHYNDKEIANLVEVATAAVARGSATRSSGSVALELLRGESQDASKQWVTLGFPGAKQSSGKLYFEVQLSKGCVAPQVGLLSSSFKTIPYVPCATGVGDDELGWSCDGLNSSLWHGGVEKAWEAHWPGTPNPDPRNSSEMCLEQDTVLGVALDLGERSITFCSNGKWGQVAAFTSADIPEGAELYPAMSVKGQASFRFGGFTHPAPPGYSPWPGMTSEPIRADVPAIGDSTNEQIYKEIQVHGEVHLQRNVQRLVAHSKYRERSKVKRSYNLLVSNAGGMDGVFHRAGAHKERPLYKSEAGAVIYWDPEVQRWKINDTEDFTKFTSSAPASNVGGGPPRRGWEVRYEMRGVASVDSFKAAMTELKVTKKNIDSLVKALMIQDQIFRESEKTTFAEEWAKLDKRPCVDEKAWEVVVNQVKANVLKSCGFDVRCQVCETEHPYPAKNFSWNKQIKMEDAGAMSVIFSPKCQTYDSCANFTISAGGMDRKAAGPGARVEVSVEGKTIHGTVQSRSENGRTWKILADRRLKVKDTAAKDVAPVGTKVNTPNCPAGGGPMAWTQGSYRRYICNSCGRSFNGERWHCAMYNSDICSNCHPAPQGTSRYNKHYYCTVIRAERLGAKKVSVVYDARGDMSAGPLQDPMDSRLFWASGSGAHKSASSSAPATSDREHHCSGTLFFDDVPTMEDLKFEFGSGGYSRLKLKLQEATEGDAAGAWEPGLGDRVEALRDDGWEVAHVVEVRQGKYEWYDAKRLPDTYIVRWGEEGEDGGEDEVAHDHIRKYQEPPDGNVLEDVKKCRGSHWSKTSFITCAEAPKVAKVEYGNVPTAPGKQKVKKGQGRAPTAEAALTEKVGDEIKNFDLDLAQPLTPIIVGAFEKKGPAQSAGVGKGWFLDIAGTITGDSSHEWARLLSGIGGVDFTDIEKDDSNPDKANDEDAKVRLSPQDGHQHKWYCGRRLGKQQIPGSNGRCGPNNGPQCASCKRFQECFQVNDEGAAVTLGTQHHTHHVWYCGRELGAEAIPGSDGRCGPNDGPQCACCQRFQGTIDALHHPEKEMRFQKRLERLVSACFKHPDEMLARITEAIKGGTLKDIALVFTNSAPLQQPKLLPTVQIAYPDGQRIGSEVRVFKRQAAAGKEVQIEEFLKQGPAYKAGVRSFWSLDAQQTLDLNKEKMKSITAEAIGENPNILLALDGVTLVFKHPCPVKKKQVTLNGSAGNNWKAPVLAGSTANVEFSTDGDGASFPDRRWGVRAVFMPFDVTAPSDKAMDELFDRFDRESKKAEGVLLPMEVERDDWDETRLRALCELHGWEFSWMTEDGEFQRRAQERESFNVDKGAMERVREVTERAAHSRAKMDHEEDAPEEPEPGES